MESNKKYTFKCNLIYKLIKGNLIKQDTEAIVNASNNNLWLGGGVSGAILKEGGRIIQKELDNIIHERKEIPNGEVVKTGIGEFQSQNLKYILHAVGPVYRNGKGNEARDLYNAFFNSFKLADELELKSISLPPISSGIFGYPKDECANVFYDSLISYADNRKEGSLEEIRMVIIDDITFEVFENIHDKRISSYENEGVKIVVYPIKECKQECTSTCKARC